MKNLKITALILAVSVSFGVHAQQAVGQSEAIGVGHGGNVSIVQPTNPAATTALVKQDGALKTTGQTFLGGAAVGSSTFQCGASAGVAAGWMGGSAGVQGAVSLRACVLLNIIAMARDDQELAVAALCSMDEGKDVMKEAGRLCPSEKRAQKQASGPNMADPYIAARMAGQ